MKILEILTERRRIGYLGERAAAKMLRRAGYRILERNYVSDGAETDIIAMKDDTLAFCEVKTRNIHGDRSIESRPAAAVTPEKQRKLISAAVRYKSYRFEGKKMRFDIIEVYYEKAGSRDVIRDIKHLAGAFDRDSAFLPPWKR